MEPLPHPLALLRRHVLPAAHVFQELLALGRVGLHHPPQLRAQLGAFLEGQLAKLPPALQHRLTLRGVHLLEAAEILLGDLALGRRHRLEPLEVAAQLGAPLGRALLPLAHLPPHPLLLPPRPPPPPPPPHP